MIDGRGGRCHLRKHGKGPSALTTCFMAAKRLGEDEQPSTSSKSVKHPSSLQRSKVTIGRAFIFPGDGCVAAIANFLQLDFGSFGLEGTQSRCNSSQ